MKGLELRAPFSSSGSPAAGCAGLQRRIWAAHHRPTHPIPAPHLRALHVLGQLLHVDRGAQRHLGAAARRATPKAAKPAAVVLGRALRRGEACTGERVGSAELVLRHRVALAASLVARLASASLAPSPATRHLRVAARRLDVALRDAHVGAQLADGGLVASRPCRPGGRRRGLEQGQACTQAALHACVCRPQPAAGPRRQLPLSLQRLTQKHPHPYAPLRPHRATGTSRSYRRRAQKVA